MYNQKLIDNLNNDINKHFPHLKTIEPDYKVVFDGVSRMVVLDRYAQKDINHKTLKVGDLVITVVKDDGVFPSRGIGYITKIDKKNNICHIEIEEQYVGAIDPYLLVEGETNIISKTITSVDKPLELFYEQIAYRVAKALSFNETDTTHFNNFYNELKDHNIVPAGRVLYGSGSGNSVTFFNCFVMPFIPDSREGISNHRKEVMEIMSRGGGVGSNGSTLRPRGTVAKGVGGRSSGTVSWLNDLSTLTHLVEQGGSRRGAQMIMLADWHPDIVEFIISKMQNAKILRWLAQNSSDETVRAEANNKLKFVPLTNEEQNFCDVVLSNPDNFDKNTLEYVNKKIKDGGTWEVNNPDYLTGANISVTLTHDFMKAVENNADWDLKFPDLDSYNKTAKKFYDKKWKEIGDVREWEQMGYKVKTYRTMKARDLWDLINFCSNYSAEPGIFFIDQANDKTNAKAYGMKIVATNPCGEQPLAPYSVCNLAAINLANFVDKNTKEILYDKLKQSVTTCVRLQDNVIDATPYFLKANELQAKGERRLGLGVMGLHDILIYAGLRYGSDEGNAVVDKIFETISTTAYRASIELAKEKGSFPFLTSREKFTETGYMKDMPSDILENIKKYGIRNSHLLTIAPTGSTGTMVGVSTGLEPYFAFEFYRSGRLGKFVKVEAAIVKEWLEHNPEYKGKELPNIFVTAMELKPEEHADVQCIIQKWVDSSISKTVNAPKGYSVKDVEKIYIRLYKNGAKGGTVYVDGSRDTQVLSLSNDENNLDSIEQVNIQNFGIETDGVQQLTDDKKAELKNLANLRGIKQDRKIGTDLGDLCPTCKEGTMIDAGGCVTCNNCGMQFKCGL